MTDWLLLANEWAAGWGAAVWRASWQGGLALGIVYALCRLAPGLPANARCWLWRIAYLKLVAALFWTTPITLPILPAESQLPAHWSFEAPQALGRPGLELDSPAATLTLPATGAASGVAAGKAELRLRPAPVRPSILLILLAVWAVGATVCGGRVLRQWRGASRLRNACEPSDDPGIAQILARLCRRLRLHGTPELLCAPVPGPLVVGVLRPAIVLPSGLQATDAEQEWILAHELGHVKRRDLLWAHLPVFTRVLLFFHPLVWLGHREWRLAQEMACDALTLRLTSASAGDYGAMLVKLAACHRARSEPDLIVARIFEPGTGLERRLSMLPASVRNSQAAWAAGGALITAAVLALAPWRVSAQPAALPASTPSGLTSAPRTTSRAPVVKAVATPSRAKEAAAAPKASDAAPKAMATPAATSPKPTKATGKAVASRAAVPAKPPVAAAMPAPQPEPNAAEAEAAIYLLHLRDAYEARFLLGSVVGSGLAAPDGPEGEPAVNSGFRATGITAGPYTTLIADLPPSEFLAFFNADRQAARTLEEVTRARVEIGQATSAELIPLQVRVQQLEILVAAAERLAARPKNRGRADLFRALTPRELVNYLAVEVNATRQLHELLQAQFRVGRIPATEVIPLTARLEQLEILLRAAERRLTPKKGDK
jgi:beta-lactamase regulating signal transducer with metallopeptidase domain